MIVGDFQHEGLALAERRVYLLKYGALLLRWALPQGLERRELELQLVYDPLVGKCGCSCVLKQ